MITFAFGVILGMTGIVASVFSLIICDFEARIKRVILCCAFLFLVVVIVSFVSLFWFTSLM